MSIAQYTCPAVALIVSGNLKAEENGLPDAPPQFLVGFCLGVTAVEGGEMPRSNHPARGR